MTIGQDMLGLFDEVLIGSNRELVTSVGMVSNEPSKFACVIDTDQPDKVSPLSTLIPSTLTLIHIMHPLIRLDLASQAETNRLPREKPRTQFRLLLLQHNALAPEHGREGTRV